MADAGGGLDATGSDAPLTPVDASPIDADASTRDSSKDVRPDASEDRLPRADMGDTREDVLPDGTGVTDGLGADVVVRLDASDGAPADLLPDGLVDIVPPDRPVDLPPPDGPFPDAAPDSPEVDAPADVVPLPDAAPTDLPSPDRGPDTSAPCPTEGETKECASASTQGSCQLGTMTCLQGQWGPCVGAWGPTSKESCNADDDDCDGTVDDIPIVACGLGVCRGSRSSCLVGVMTECDNLATAAASDPCNGADDDCDGEIDENCPTCVPVSETGDDDTADGTTGAPFKTIQKAIAWAVADLARPRRICVAGGSACGSTTYIYSGPLSIPSGIAVHGGYESTAWTLCSESSTPPTRIRTGSESGISFVRSSLATTTATELSRFEIQRQWTDSSQPSIGVTVADVKDVVLAGISITDAPNVRITYGVRISIGASASIYRSTIYGGDGTSVSAGVRVEDGYVTLQQNCDHLDAYGGCSTECATSAQGLHARTSTSAAPSNSWAYAVWVTGSSGTIIQGNALCANVGDHGAGLYFASPGAGITVRGNVIEADGSGTEVQGVAMTEGCAEPSPWLVANTLIQARSSGAGTTAQAISVAAGCQALIDQNAKIAVEASGNAGAARAIHCAGNSGCAILKNTVLGPQAGATSAPVTAIDCAGSKSCSRIISNDVQVAYGKDPVAILLSGSEAVLYKNKISLSACGTGSTAGVLATDGSWASLVKNDVSASRCSTSGGPDKYIGVAIRHDGSRNQVLLDQNAIDASGRDGTCESDAIDISSTQADSAPYGVFTNNTLVGGRCSVRRDFNESGTMRSRVLRANSFSAANSLVLYHRGTTDITSVSGVNALSDGTTSSENNLLP